MAARTQSLEGKGKSAGSIIESALAVDTDKAARRNGKSPTEMHELLLALQAMRAGDFSVRMAGDHEGIAGKIAETFNEIVAANQRMSKELERAGALVGREV